MPTILLLTQPPEAMPSKPAHQQLQQSMRAAGSHDNIVALRGLCHHEGRFALVMEYCPRGTLDVLLHHTASKRMEVSRLLLLIRSIARGMLHLHTRRPPILHRDLKPANIFVGGRGCPVQCLCAHPTAVCASR